MNTSPSNNMGSKRSLIAILLFLIVLINHARAAADPAIIIEAVRSRVQQDYDAMGTVVCIQKDYSPDCAPPWFHPSNYWYYNFYVEQRTDPCNTDTGYGFGNDHDFWGWSSRNISRVLNRIGIQVAAYATQKCITNNQCNNTYQQPQTMFDTYLGYLNSTFIASVTKYLERHPLENLCPLVGGYGPLPFATNSISITNLILGLYNPILVPGAFKNAPNDTLIQETKAEMARIQRVSSSYLEGIFLSMVYGSRTSPTKKDKRGDLLRADNISEEIYPGCSKRLLVLGGCKGITPPRTGDPNGAGVPMARRLRMEHENRGNHEVTSLDTRARTASCAEVDEIKSNIKAYQIAQTRLSSAQADVNLAGLLESPALLAEFSPFRLATPIGDQVFGGAVMLGTAYFAMSLVVTFCGMTGSCNYLPSALKNTVRTVNGINDATTLRETFDSDLRLTAIVPKKFNLLTGFDIDVLLSTALHYQRVGLQCCQQNCDADICTQAAYTSVQSWLNPNCEDRSLPPLA